MTVFFGLTVFSVGCVVSRALRQVFACDLVTYTQSAPPGREEKGVYVGKGRGGVGVGA